MKTQITTLLAAVDSKNFFRALVVSLAGLCSTTALAESYRVTVDTSALVGTSGFIDLQLNPADLFTPAAIANITDPFGSLLLLAPPLAEGDVVGAFPGPVTLTNSTPFNDYFQQTQFNSSFSLLFNFSGDFLTTPSAAGTSFALSLYGADGITPLLTTDASGSLLRFELAAAGISYQTFPAVIAGASAAQVTLVPLPATAWLFASGLLAFARVRLAKRKSVATEGTDLLVART